MQNNNYQNNSQRFIALYLFRLHLCITAGLCRYDKQKSCTANSIRSFKHFRMIFQVFVVQRSRRLFSSFYSFPYYRQGLCISYHFRSLRFISKPAIRYHYKAITNKEAVLHQIVSRNLNKKSCKNWSKRRMNSINRNLANHRAH